MKEQCKVEDLKPGDVAIIKTREKTKNGLRVANIQQTSRKSFLKVSFQGGICFEVNRFDEAIKVKNENAGLVVGETGPTAG